MASALPGKQMGLSEQRPTYSGQVADADPTARQEGHQDLVVQGDEDHDGQRVEDGQRGCRDLQAPLDAPVHHLSLLHKEATHLQHTWQVSHEENMPC